MTKQKQIAHFKQILEAAKMLKAVAAQELNTATRLESEAIAALDELGVQKGRGRKAKYEMPEEMILQLRAKITS